MLQHEGSFIATQDSSRQDSLLDPCADKSHGSYLVSWLSGGTEGQCARVLPPVYKYTLGRAPSGLGKLAGFWFHPDPNSRQGRESSAEIRDKSCFSPLLADPRHPSPRSYPSGPEKLSQKTWRQKPTLSQWNKQQ